MSIGVCMNGLDGSNPLAFLAALGVLRGLTLDAEARAGAAGAADDDPAEPVRMWWTRERGVWMPWLSGEGLASEEEMLVRIGRVVREHGDHPTLMMGDNFSCTPDAYREHVRALEVSGHDSDLLASLGTDAAVDDEGLCLDTAFRTMRGAGHQHFLKTMRAALHASSPAHLQRTLLGRWDYLDPVRGLSLRIDPLDDRRYAHQWTDPSCDPTRADRGGMTGATALAVMGLPMFPVLAGSRSAVTLGFRSSRQHGVEWTWPIWSGPCSLGVVYALLALDELQADTPDRRTLGRRGIVDVHRTRRITIGKFRNFTPAVSV